MAENELNKQRRRGLGRPFQKGQSGNPAGRPKGARDHATRMALALIEGKAKEVVDKALELALAGDGPVLRAILDRLCPPRKDSPVTLVNLPKLENAAELPKVSAMILEAVANGELFPSEGQALAGLLDGHRKALETAELETRVAALEKNLGGK